MEPTLRSGFDSGNQQKPKVKNKQFFNKARTIVKKFWYIFLVAGIAIGIVIGVTISSSSKAAAWQRATDAFGRADYETAKKEIGNMPLPSDENKLKLYSQTMLATRTLDKALSGYEKLHEKTKDPATLLILGNIYNQQGKYDKAIEAYKEVIADNSNNIQAYVNLSTVYKLRQDSKQAVAVAQEAVEKNQRSTVAHELLVSMLLDQKGSDAYNSAVKGLRELNPQDPLLESINAQ